MAKAPTPKEKVKKPFKPRAGFGGPQPNSGRKSKAEMMGLLALLDKCWSAPDRENCVLHLAELANSGDMDAIKLLFNYTFGKPKETREVSGPGGGEIAVTVRYVNRGI